MTGRPPTLRLEIEAVVVATPWPDACIIFSGKPQPNGYGRVSVAGRYWRAHVFACFVAHGWPTSEQTDAAHSCAVRMCINPRHLRWATRAENEADKVQHGRSNRGERCGAARLSGAAVRRIRARYTSGKWTQQRLADTYGVHVMTINDIVHRRTWRHI